MKARLTDSREQFYEAYWSRNANVVPDNDPTAEDRKRLLRMALERYLSKSHDGTPLRCRKVLDAGCGSGEFSVFIKELGFDVVGIDVSQTAIERAKQSYPGNNFHRLSLEGRLPFSDGEFDAIWSTEVLEHLFDVHAALSELNRVLGQGRVVMLTVPFHGFLKNLMIALVGFEQHYHPYLSHIRFFTKGSLTNCLLRAGFEPVLWCGIGRIWPFYKSFFVVARKVKLPGPAPEILG